MFSVTMSEPYDNQLINKWPVDDLNQSEIHIRRLAVLRGQIAITANTRTFILVGVVVE